MAGFPYDSAKFEESKKYYQRLTTLLPTDPDPPNMVGAIDWTLAFRVNAEMRHATRRIRRHH